MPAESQLRCLHSLMFVAVSGPSAHHIRRLVACISLLQQPDLPSLPAADLSRMSSDWGAAMSPHHHQQQQASSVQGFGPLGIPAQDPQARQLEAQLAELRDLQLHQGRQGGQGRTLWEAPGDYGSEVRPQKICATPLGQGLG